MAEVCQQQQQQRCRFKTDATIFGVKMRRHCLRLRLLLLLGEGDVFAAAVPSSLQSVRMKTFITLETPRISKGLKPFSW